jgi:hypothetical protein
VDDAHGATYSDSRDFVEPRARESPRYDARVGVVFGGVTISATHIRQVLEFPPLLWRFVAPDDPEAYAHAVAAHAGARRPGLLARLFGRGAAPPPAAPPADVEFAPGEGVDWDVDKAWHGIHFLLTGSAGSGLPPLDFINAGGTPVPGSDNGLGAARLLSPAQAAAVHRALEAVTDDTLAARLDLAAMDRAKVYPGHWTQEEPAIQREYVMDGVAKIRGAFRDAVTHGHGMLVYFS